MAEKRFLVRVELKGENQKDSDLYEKLHKAMDNAGFVRYFIQSGAKMPLPHATYKLKGDYTALQVKNKALTIAEKVWIEDSVLIVAVEYDDDTISCKL